MLALRDLQQSCEAMINHFRDVFVHRDTCCDSEVEAGEKARRVDLFALGSLMMC